MGIDFSMYCTIETIASHMFNAALQKKNRLHVFCQFHTEDYIPVAPFTNMI